LKKSARCGDFLNSLICFYPWFTSALKRKIYNFFSKSYISATAASVAGRFVGSISRTAAAFAIIAPEHGIDDRVGTPDAGLHRNGVCRTVERAGTAFHAGIAILYRYVLRVHLEHFMRANIKAHSATYTFVFIQLQSDNVFKINKIFHFLIS